jgi:hypothetical protein
MQAATTQYIFQASPDKIENNAPYATEEAKNASQRYIDWLEAPQSVQVVPVTVPNNAVSGAARENGSTKKAATMKALVLAHLMPLQLPRKEVQYEPLESSPSHDPFVYSEADVQMYENSLIADMAGCKIKDSAEVNDQLIDAIEKELAFKWEIDHMQVERADGNGTAYAPAADRCPTDEVSLPQYGDENEDELFHESEPDTSLPDWYMDPSDNVVQTFSAMLEEMEAADSKRPRTPDKPAKTKKVNVRHPVDPFTAETYKSNLVHCPPTDPSDDIDMLDFYAKEYIRSLRLLKARKRWGNMRICDWKLEMKTITTALANPENNLQVWQPLADWFNLYHRAMAEACKTTRTKYKNMLLKELDRVAKMKITENRAALVDLLEVKDQVVAPKVWTVAKRAVNERCDRAGSLSLGSIPEFTNGVRMKMSHTWAWVD